MIDFILQKTLNKHKFYVYKKRNRHTAFGAIKSVFAEVIVYFWAISIKIIGAGALKRCRLAGTSFSAKICIAFQISRHDSSRECSDFGS